MDDFSGYNQIWMALEDEEKITFIANHGLYYYKVMLFELKNACMTYQCLINKIFKDQINWNMKMYIDDMLVKSQANRDHIANL